MSLASLSTSQLGRLVQLIRSKEAIQAKLLLIQSAIDKAGIEMRDGNATAPTSLRLPRRRRRRALKEALLKELKAAGPWGLSVKDLAAKLNANLGSVSVWFYTTGKKVKRLRKVGRARYAFS